MPVESSPSFLPGLQMIRLTITTTLPSSRTATSATMWFAFEADFKDFEEMHDVLCEDGCIKGERVYTKDGGFGHRIVTSRVPYIVGINAVATIAPCHIDYVDAPAGAE